MGKNKLRKIVVLENTYLWKVEHYHLRAFQYSECVDRVVIYLNDCKHSPLILHFRLEDNVLLANSNDWFMDSGSIIKEGKSINLNRPKVIAKLIEYHIDHYWKPKTETKPLEITDALRLLDLLELPNDHIHNP